MYPTRYMITPKSSTLSPLQMQQEIQENPYKVPNKSKNSFSTSRTRNQLPQTRCHSRSPCRFRLVGNETLIGASIICHQGPHIIEGGCTPWLDLWGRGWRWRRWWRRGWRNWSTISSARRCSSSSADRGRRATRIRGPSPSFPSTCWSTLQEPSSKCQVPRQTRAVIEPLRRIESCREKVPRSLRIRDCEIGVANPFPARIDLRHNSDESCIPFRFDKCRGTNEGGDWREGDHVDSFGHFFVVGGTVCDAEKGRVIHLVHPVDAGDVVGQELSGLSGVVGCHQDVRIQRSVVSHRLEITQGGTCFALRT
jgi:hypothetical protein